MTDTTARQTVSSQFCGSCGAAVRSYWNACPNCKTALDPVLASSLAAPGPAEPASAPPRTPRSWSGQGSNAAEARTPFAPAPEPPPPAAAWAPPAPSYSAPPPSAPAPSYFAPPPAAPSYAPPAPSFAAPESYSPPGWSQTAQYPAATPSYRPSYSRDEPAQAKPARSGGPWIGISILLLVLLLVAGGFSIYLVTSLSSRKADLNATRSSLQTAQRDLAASKAELTDANATKASQSSQLAAYKTCISDLNILFNAAQGSAAQTAADKQAQKDCVPLGLG